MRKLLANLKTSIIREVNLWKDRLLSKKFLKHQKQTENIDFKNRDAFIFLQFLETISSIQILIE